MLSPDRRAVRVRKALLNRHRDRITGFIPQRGSEQTSGMVSGSVDCSVSLKFGVFVALPAVAIVLIRDLDPVVLTGSLAAVAALTSAADRSHLTFRWTSAH